MVTELVIPAYESSSFRKGLLPSTLRKFALYQTHRPSVDPDQKRYSYQIDRSGLTTSFIVLEEDVVGRSNAPSPKSYMFSSVESVNMLAYRS